MNSLLLTTAPLMLGPGPLEQPVCFRSHFCRPCPLVLAEQQPAPVQLPALPGGSAGAADMSPTGHLMNFGAGVVVGVPGGPVLTLGPVGGGFVAGASSVGVPPPVLVPVPYTRPEHGPFAPPMLPETPTQNPPPPPHGDLLPHGGGGEVVPVPGSLVLLLAAAAGALPVWGLVEVVGWVRRRAGR